jgi:hypothetical protein
MSRLISKIITTGLSVLIHLLLFTLVLSQTSCRSAKQPASARFAHVVIAGNTPGQIRNATVGVFLDNGYKARQTDPGNMVFEKEGSRMNNFAYGNWMGDTPVWIRVKASIVALGEMSCRVQCAAYLVRDIGSAAEEELPVSSLHRGLYQKMLEDVANRLARK